MPSGVRAACAANSSCSSWISVMVGFLGKAGVGVGGCSSKAAGDRLRVVQFHPAAQAQRPHVRPGLGDVRQAGVLGANGAVRVPPSRHVAPGRPDGVLLLGVADHHIDRLVVVVRVVVVVVRVVVVRVVVVVVVVRVVVVVVVDVVVVGVVVVVVVVVVRVDVVRVRVVVVVVRDVVVRVRVVVVRVVVVVVRDEVVRVRVVVVRVVVVVQVGDVVVVVHVAIPVVVVVQFGAVQVAVVAVVQVAVDGHFFSSRSQCVTTETGWLGRKSVISTPIPRHCAWARTNSASAMSRAPSPNGEKITNRSSTGGV